MPVFSPAYMILDWYIETAFNHLMFSRFKPTYQLRYEDFVAAPETRLHELLERVGSTAPVPAALRERREIELGNNHTVQGNPLRFRRGRIAIKPDLKWKKEMKPLHRTLVTTATWPFLRKYGYLGNSEPAPAGGSSPR